LVEVLVDEVKVTFDSAQPLRSAGVGHNRWHPVVPPIVHASAREHVILQTRDAQDGQVTPQTAGE